MLRLFTGLEIPSDVQDALSLLRGGLPGARWIDPENYHITLRFIGDIDDRLAHDIASLLDGVRKRPFDVRFEELASFGGYKPRAVIAAVDPVSPLVALQAERAHQAQRRFEGPFLLGLGKRRVIHPRCAQCHPENAGKHD